MFEGMRAASFLSNSLPQDVESGAELVVPLPWQDAGSNVGGISPQKSQRVQNGIARRGNIRNPFEVVLEEHPDSTLRQIGLLRQKVKFSKYGKTHTARFDPLNQRWFDEDTNLEVGDASPELSSSEPVAAVVETPNPGRGQSGSRTPPPKEAWVETSVSNKVTPQAQSRVFDPLESSFKRIDTAPSAVILVVGEWTVPQTTNPYECSDEELSELEALLTLKLSMMQNEVQSEPSKNKKSLVEGAQKFVTAAISRAQSVSSCLESVQKQLLLRRKTNTTCETIGPQASDPMLIANLGDEHDGRFLSEAEVSQHIRQYFVRSIPFAAVNSGAVVATCCVGSIGTLLSQGLAAVSTTHEVTSMFVFGDDESVVRQMEEQQVNFSHCVQVIPRRHLGIEGTGVKKQDVVGTLQSLVVELSKGVGDDDEPPTGFIRKPSQRPLRSGVPVAVVAAGGSNELRFELIVCALRQWSVFLIEGSGGYTDYLISVLKHIRDPAVSPELKALSLSKLDPTTFEIVDIGRLYVVERGQIVDTLSQSLVFSLKGDDTLRCAWSKYASWHDAGESYRNIYVVLLYVLVLLGVFSTGLSVFQTVMQVVWVNETKGADNTSSTVGRIFSALNLVVIFLPLLIQLVQSVFNKISAGPKWAAFTWAAENCLREIYLARVQAKEYSADEVRAAARKSAKAKRERLLASGADTQETSKGNNRPDNTGQTNRQGGSEEPTVHYSTKQELLSIRLEALTNELMINVANTLIRPYEGPLPPLEKRFFGDDGFSELSSDDYVRLRIEPRLAMYKEDAMHVTKVRVVLECGLHLFNTGGTVLGALATYQFLPNTNLQAWVAFTTSVVSAMTRVEHWMLYEWKQRKYVQSYMKLNSVMSWWSSRGSQVASTKTKSELCDRAEGVILGELTEFCQQLRTASESIKKTDDSNASANSRQSELVQALQQALSGGDTHHGIGRDDKLKRDIGRFVNELPLDLITPANVEAAAKDPTSLVAKHLKNLLNELNHEFGDVVGAHKRRMEELRGKIEQFDEPPFTFVDIEHLVTDKFGCISVPRNLSNKLRCFEYTKLLPRPVQDMIDSSHKRSMFLSAFQEQRGDLIGIVRLQTVRDAAASVDKDNVRLEMAKLPARLLLEVARLSLREEAVHQFSESLLTAKISPHDLTPKKAKLWDTLQILRPISFLPWRSLCAQDILGLIDDEAVRKQLSRALSDAKLRALLKRVESFFRAPSEALDLEHDLLGEAVHMDVFNELLGSTEGRILTSQMRYQMRILDVSPNLLSRKELIKLFNATPSALSPCAFVSDTIANMLADGSQASQLLTHLPQHVACLSQEVLAQYVTVLSQQLPATTCLISASWRLAAALAAETNAVSNTVNGTLFSGTPATRGPQSLVAASTARAAMAALATSNTVTQNKGFFFMKSVEPIFVMSSRVDQLASFVLSTPQAGILTSRKEHILKLLMGETNAKDLVDILRTLDAGCLHRLLCTTHALMGGTYVGEVFDRLSIEMQTFNPSKTLNYEEQLLLLGRLSEFGPSEDITALTKQTILERLALKPLAHRLQTLKDYQLHDLLIRLRCSMLPLFSDSLAKRLLKFLRAELKKNNEVMSFAQAVEPLHWHMVVRCLGRLDTRILDYYCRFTQQRGPAGVEMMRVVHHSEWATLIPDRDVQRTVTSLRLTVEEIKSLCRVSSDIIEDWISVDALERIATEFNSDQTIIETLEDCLGSEGRLRGTARGYLFSSLILLAARGVTTLTQAESVGRLSASDLLRHIEDTVSVCDLRMLRALQQGDMILFLKLCGKGSLSPLPEVSDTISISPFPVGRPPHNRSAAEQDKTVYDDTFERGIKTIHKELKEALDVKYPIFIASLLSSLMIHGPTHVFQDVARSHDSHDLRQVFETLVSRVHLTLMGGWWWNAIVEIVTDWHSANRGSGSDRWRGRLKAFLRSGANAAPLRPDNASVEHTPSRGDEVDVGDDTEDMWSTLGRTMDDLGELPEEDAVKVLHLTLKSLHRTRVGQFVLLLAATPAHSDSGCEAPLDGVAKGLYDSQPVAQPVEQTVFTSYASVLDKDSVTYSRILTVAATIAPQITTSKRDLFEGFLRFDEKAFFARSHPEKLSTFKQFLFDDSAAQYVSNWREVEIEQLFAFFRCRGPFVRLQVSSERSKVAHTGNGLRTPVQTSMKRRNTSLQATVVAMSRIVSLKVARQRAVKSKAHPKEDSSTLKVDEEADAVVEQDNDALADSVPPEGAYSAASEM